MAALTPTRQEARTTAAGRVEATASAIDHVHISTPPLLQTQYSYTTAVLRVTAKRTALSDHAPFALTIAPKLAHPRGARPIPRWVSSHPSFPTVAHRRLRDAANDDLHPNDGLRRAKQALHAVARQTIWRCATRYPTDPHEALGLLMQLARAIARSGCRVSGGSTPWSLCVSACVCVCHPMHTDCLDVRHGSISAAERMLGSHASEAIAQTDTQTHCDTLPAVDVYEWLASEGLDPSLAPKWRARVQMLPRVNLRETSKGMLERRAAGNVIGSRAAGVCGRGDCHGEDSLRGASTRAKIRRLGSSPWTPANPLASRPMSTMFMRRATARMAPFACLTPSKSSWGNLGA